MYEFLSIVLIIFGVLQIILFFKMWGMTNDVRKIKNELDAHKNENTILIEAQIKSLDRDNEKAFELYKKAFYLNIIELYNKTILEYGSEDELEYDVRNKHYNFKYEKIVKHYSKRFDKIKMKFDFESLNSYSKVNKLICK